MSSNQQQDAVDSVVAAISQAGGARASGPPGRGPVPRPSGTPLATEKPRTYAIPILWVLAVLLAALRYGIVKWQLPETPPQLHQILLAIRTNTGWAYPAAAGAAGLAVLLMILRWRRHRFDADSDRVRSAAGSALHVPPEKVYLRKAKWNRAGQLKAGVISYPRGSVLSDLAGPLAELVTVFAVGPMQASWQRRGDRFILSPRPPAVKRLEERWDKVKLMYQNVGHLLAGAVIDQRLTKVTEAGELTSLVVNYAHTTKDIADAFRNRVQTVLDSKAPSPTGYWKLQWDPAGSKVTITPSVPLPTSAEYPLAPPQDRLKLPIGIKEGGKVDEWDPEKDPHMLVVGRTGSGKTIFLNDLVTGACARDWQVFLADPKELSFSGFKPDVLRELGLPVWPGVEEVATSEKEMEQVIERVYLEMRNRYQALKTFKVSEKDLQPVLLIIDEAGELVERLTAYHQSEDKLRDLLAEAEALGLEPDKVIKPKGTKNPQLQKIWSILRLGRQCRVFVIIATQRPDVSFIPGEARANLVTRAGLGNCDAYALEMAFGTRAVQQRTHEFIPDPETGEIKRTKIRGRATLDLGRGPVNVQIPWHPDPGKAITGVLSKDDKALVARLHEFVVTNNKRWKTDAVMPPVTVNMAKPTALPAAWVLDDDAGDSDRRSFQGVSTNGLETVRADALSPYTVALLEVDGQATPVIITEIEIDPDSIEPENPDATEEEKEDFAAFLEYEITYEIAAPDPRAGEVGVTTIGASEPVHILERHDEEAAA